MIGQHPQHDSRTLTLADRDERSARFLVEHLAVSQWRIRTAATTAEAVACLQRHPTPVVLDGLSRTCDEIHAFVRQVRQAAPATAVVLLTQQPDLPSAAAALQIGVDHLFLKPLRWEEVKAPLTGLLSRPGTGSSTLSNLSMQERETLPDLRLPTWTNEKLAGLLTALEGRDPVTHHHMRRVRRYALLLSRFLNLERQHRWEIGFAARLHDVGKLLLDHEVLHKPTALTTTEEARLRAHPVVAEDLVRPLLPFPRLLAGIRHHHERMDGQGYHDRLAGVAVPFEARLIAVVDCFDAVTSERPYRGKMLSADAGMELLRHQAAEGQLDPFLVSAFRKLYRRHPVAIKRIMTPR